MNHFSDIGRNLGLAFQIRDDILGIWGDQSETGKPAGNDIRRHKKSYPVVFALDNSNGPLRDELIALYQNPVVSDPTVNQVLQIFESLGAKASAQKMVEAYSNQAWQSFKRLDLSPPNKQRMEEIVQFLTGRTY